VIRPLLPASIALLLATACRHGDSSHIEGTGTVEVVETDVSPLVPARVIRVWVDEGHAVRQGDTLVALTQSTTSSDIESRQARLAAAVAQEKEAVAGPRSAEVQEARAQLASAEAEAARTAHDVDRLTPLASSGTVSAQQLDAARGSAAVAAGRRDAARQVLQLLMEGTRPERIAAARAEVAAARAALVGVQSTARDLLLLAPVDGVVLSRHVEPGEMLGAGAAALTIGDLARPWVRVFLEQGAVATIRLGDSAVARLDGRPDQPFHGRVVAINPKAEFTPRIALTERERADLLFGVKVALSDTTRALKPGLPVTVRFESAGRPQ